MHRLSTDRLLALFFWGLLSLIMGIAGAFYFVARWSSGRG